MQQHNCWLPHMEAVGLRRTVVHATFDWWDGILAVVARSGRLARVPNNGFHTARLGAHRVLLRVSVPNLSFLGDITLNLCSRQSLPNCGKQSESLRRRSVICTQCPYLPTVASALLLGICVRAATRGYLHRFSDLQFPMAGLERMDHMSPRYLSDAVPSSPGGMPLLSTLMRACISWWHN